MLRALKILPDSRCKAVERIEVSLARPRPDALLLHYVVAGEIGDLRLPPQAEPARVDELWKHTCFEVFVRPYADERYFEVNMAPSRQWATYAFSGYRSGMRAAEEIEGPDIETSVRAGRFFNLRAALDLSRLPALEGPWRVGISAVIEETSGAKSYWALAHPQGKPDFHHADSFALNLPAETT